MIGAILRSNGNESMPDDKMEMPWTDSALNVVANWYKPKEDPDEDREEVADDSDEDHAKLDENQSKGIYYSGI